MYEKSNILQPYINPGLSDHITDQTVISSPAHMLIYELKDINAPLKFISSPYCEWIIGYNNSANSSHFYCIGSSDKAFDFIPDCFQSYFCVRFDADICYLNKNHSANAALSSLRNEIIDYIPVENSPEAQLLNSFRNSFTFRERVKHFITFLNTNKSLCTIPDNVRNILRLIESNNGDISVSQISESSGYSDRHINRLIHTQLGYGPKDYCKYIRFQRALSELISDPRRNNSEFIQTIGYSDQAHFQREFKLFMNITPKQFINEAHLI